MSGDGFRTLAARRIADRLMKNIEIKLRLTGYREALEYMASLTGQEPAVLEQTDTYFKTNRGRLKLREEDGRSELIFYVRPDRPRSKVSDYHRVDLDEPRGLKDLLARALSIDVVVEKTRNLFFQGATRIHIDEVPGLGHFIEIEVPVAEGESKEPARATIEAILSGLPGIPEPISVSYSDMLRDSR